MRISNLDLFDACVCASTVKCKNPASSKGNVKAVCKQRLVSVLCLDPGQEHMRKEHINQMRV